MLAPGFCELRLCLEDLLSRSMALGLKLQIPGEIFASADNSERIHK